MMFTLFGDYIRRYGGEVWVGTLIKMAAPFGLSEQAVRSSLSRMGQNGWLRVRRVGSRSYYRLTPRATRLLDEGEHRIFGHRDERWDGQWRILVYSLPEQKRNLRSELRKQLAWLGYAPLSSGSWVCPHDLRGELGGVLGGLGIEAHVEAFSARHQGYSDDRELAARCWDLDGINRRYAAFLARYQPMFEMFKGRQSISDGECFVQRFLLIHEYRKFFFIDPELPVELQPADWRGGAARELFHDFHALLAEPANRYFESVFEAPASDRRTRGRPRVARPAVAAVTS